MQDNKAFQVRNIKWQTDGDEVALPTSASVECPNEASIADHLSESYGWLVESFEIIKPGQVHGA